MLKIRNVTCGYGLRFRLRNISLAIGDGELVGIIGPNGSGKTTLLRTITKLLEPTEGEVLLEEKDISKMTAKDLARKIAVVPQSLNIDGMSVEEFVLLGRLPHFEKFQLLEAKKDFEAVKKCMELTDTYRLKDRLMEEMSGGERQLVLIARALAQEPKLLLLDEPTAHLDITHQVQILDMIKRLNREFGLTVLMVLHELNLASEYCRRLVLMNNGRIHKTGTAEEVLDYRVIEEVYKTVVVVERNPISSKPYVLIVPQEQRKLH